MELRGHVENGKVVLDGSVELPDGTEVAVRALRPARTDSKRSKKNPPLSKRLLRHAGAAQGLPRDASRNLDHYLYGHPRR